MLTLDSDALKRCRDQQSWQSKQKSEWDYRDIAKYYKLIDEWKSYAEGANNWIRKSKVTNEEPYRSTAKRNVKPSVLIKDQLACSRIGN